MYDAPAAESGHPDPVGPRRRKLLHIGDDGGEVRHDLRIGHRVGHLQNGLDVRQVQHAPFAGVRLEGDGEEAALGETAHDVLDVLVHSPNFRDHDHHRVFPRSRRVRLVDRNLEPPDADLSVGHRKAIGRRS